METLKLVVGVVTHNVFSTLRSDLLLRTVKSIDIAFAGSDKILLDNGSTDGTDEFCLESQDISRDWQVTAYKPSDGITTPGRGHNELIKHVLKRKPGVVVFSDDDMRWYENAGETLRQFWQVTAYKPSDGITTPGRGHNELIKHVLKRKPGVVVFSDDDMRWYENAGETLRQFWQEKPSDPVILCGLLEPEWDWNTPREAIERGGVKALVRDSCPGAAWTFLAEGQHKIFPVDDGFGYDHKKCIELCARGMRVAQIDLCEHLGWEMSTHGNNALAHAGNQPIDKKKWGLE